MQLQYQQKAKLLSLMLGKFIKYPPRQTNIQSDLVISTDNSILPLTSKWNLGSTFSLFQLWVSQSMDNLKIWAATWQNQQNECAPNEDSDLPGHPPSLISVFAVRMKKAWVLSYPLSKDSDQTESLLVAHSFCWFCHVVAHMDIAR